MSPSPAPVWSPMADAGVDPTAPSYPMPVAPPPTPSVSPTGCEAYTGTPDRCLAIGPSCGYCFDDGSCRSAPNYGEFGNCVSWQWGELPPPPPPTPTSPTAECGSDTDCGSGRACVSGICVGTGALRFTLRWHDNTDADLHVITPTGTEIYWLHRSADNGELDVDDIPGGPDSVENIFFTTPMSGMYEVWVENFNGNSTLSYELDVNSNGNLVASHPGSLPAMRGMESAHHQLAFP